MIHNLFIKITLDMLYNFWNIQIVKYDKSNYDRVSDNALYTC